MAETRPPRPPERRLGSLRAELLRWLLVPLAGLVLFNAANVYRHAVEAADLAYDRTLLASSRAIAERLALTEGKVTVDVPYAALDIFETDTPGRMYYAVTGIDGEFVSGYDDFPRLPPDIPRSDIYPALVHFYTGSYRGTPIRIAALYQPVLDDRTQGMVLVQVGETLDARRILTRRVLLESVWPQLALIAAVALLMVFAVRRGLAPLRRLADEIGARQQTDLAELHPEAVHREVRPLVEAMNRYIARLSAVIEAYRRFIGDAAHQLRTPLTLLRTQSDVGLREQSVPALHEVLGAIHATVERAAHAANQLLSLARIGHVSAGLFQSVDLASITRDVCLELGPAAVRKHVDLAFEGPEHAVVSGDAILLHELVMNLVDNAIRYTPSGGHVLVTARDDGRSVELRVEDSGPGVPEADRARVLEPFVRLVPPGMEAQPGSGLGLTIARDIARAHGASLALGATSLGGLEVRLALAAAPVHDADTAIARSK